MNLRPFDNSLLQSKLKYLKKLPKNQIYNKKKNRNSLFNIDFHGRQHSSVLYEGVLYKKGTPKLSPWTYHSLSSPPLGCTVRKPFSCQGACQWHDLKRVAEKCQRGTECF